MRTFLIAFLGVSLTGLFLVRFVYRTAEVENRPIILGHGGCGVRSIHPLNSIQSIKKAFELGADGVEIDVRISRDGELFAFNGNNDNKKCGEAFESLSSQEIKTYEIDSWIQSSPIKTLKETIQLAVPPGKLISLDLKTEGSPSSVRIEQFANAISAVMNQEAQFNFLIESEKLLLLENIHQLNPKAKLFWNLKEIDEQVELSDIGLEGVVLHIDNLNDQTLQELENSDLKLMVWGVGNVFDNRKALRLNANIIQTDDLGSMNQILE